jgi:enoyl-[acyl-carrier protein] reductase III
VTIRLDGCTALITGASRGVGRACALRMARAGADIIVNYVASQSAAEAVAAEIQALGRKVAVVKADIAWQDDIDSMMHFVREQFGSLDILVANAASGGFRPLVSTTALNFEAAMNTNVRSLLFLVQAALPLLDSRRRRAKVVALSSHGSFLALPMYGLIGATKAAMESMIRHLALELGGRGINFNILLAGLLDTDSSRQIPGFDKLAEVWATKMMMGDRELALTDIADVAVFLSSPLSDLIQAQTIVVDGGASGRA